MRPTHSLHYPVLLLLLLLIVAIPSLLQAQTGTDSDDIRPAPDIDEICTLDHFFQDEHFHLPARKMARGTDPSMMASTADFELTFSNNCSGSSWPQAAVEAIEYAAEIWSGYISSSVPIRIRADWAEIDPLGSAGPTLVVHSSNIPGSTPGTWYPIAQAKAMAGVDFTLSKPTEDYDIRMEINCTDVTWHYGTDAAPGSGQYDLVTVALHEIGHGLGFIGTLRETESGSGIATWGQTGPGGSSVQPFIFDRFIQDGNEIHIVDEGVYPNPSSMLHSAGTGGEGGLYFTGEETNGQFFGDPVPIYTPPSWSAGSSYSHLNSSTFSQTENALMRPNIASATAIHTPGPIVCGIFSDKGWPIGPNCASYLSRSATIAFESEEELDFQILNEGQSRELSFLFSNDSESEDAISGSVTLSSGSGFTLAGGGGTFQLEPGESREVTVRFSPTAVQNYSGIISVQHNAMSRTSPILISLSGEGLEAEILARLEPNYPNPFQSSTTIPYALPEAGHVTLEIYDSAGRRVAQLVNEEKGVGVHEAIFHAGPFASGVYFYRILIGNYSDVQSLMLAR